MPRSETVLSACCPAAKSDRSSKRRIGASTRSTQKFTVSEQVTRRPTQVSRLCEETDEKVKAFLDRPIEGDWPYLWIDATYLKVRRGGRIVSVAAIIAVAVWTCLGKVESSQ